MNKQKVKEIVLKLETKYFLETYLNTHLRLNGTVSSEFSVQYFDYTFVTDIDTT